MKKEIAMPSVKEDRFLDAAEWLKALSHPLRLEILCGLRSEPSTQTYIANLLGIPQSTVAQHLKVLRSKGLVASRRKGVEVVFYVADERASKVIDVLCRKRAGSEYTWREIAQVEKRRRAV